MIKLTDVDGGKCALSEDGLTRVFPSRQTAERFLAQPRAEGHFLAELVASGDSSLETYFTWLDSAQLGPGRFVAWLDRADVPVTSDTCPNLFRHPANLLAAPHCIFGYGATRREAVLAAADAAGQIMWDELPTIEQIGRRAHARCRAAGFGRAVSSGQVYRPGADRDRPTAPSIIDIVDRGAT